MFSLVSLHCLQLYPSHITAQGQWDVFTSLTPLLTAVSQWDVFTQVSLHCLQLYPSHITAQGSPVRCFHSVSLHCLQLYPSHITAQGSPVRCFHSVSLHCYCCIPHTSQPKAVQWDVFTQSHSTAYCCIPHTSQPKAVQWQPKAVQMFSLSLTPLLTAVSLTHHSPRQSSEMFSLVSLHCLLLYPSHLTAQGSPVRCFHSSLTPLLTAVSLTHHSPRQSSEMFSLKSHSTAYCCIPHTSQPKAVQWDVFTQVSLHCLLLYPSHITAQGSPVRCFHSSLTPLLTAVSLTHHSPRQSSEMFSLTHSTAYCCIPHTSQPKAVQWDVFTPVSLHCLLLYPSHITAQGSPVRCFHSSLTPLLTAVSLTHHSPRQSSEMFSLQSHSTAYCCIPHTSQPKAVQWDVFTQVSLHCLLLYPSHITAQGSPVRCFHSSLTPLLTAVSLTHHSPRQSSEMFSLQSHSTAYCCIPHTSQPKAVQWDVFTPVSLHCLLLYPSHITAQGSPVRCFHSSLTPLLTAVSLTHHSPRQSSEMFSLQSHSTAYCCIPHTSQPKAVQWDVFTPVSLHCLLLYPSHITAQGSPVRCFHSSLTPLLTAVSLTHHSPRQSSEMFSLQSHSTAYCCIPHTSQPKAVQWDVFTQVSLHCLLLYPSHITAQGSPVRCFHSSLTPLLTAVSLTHHSPRQSSEMFSLKSHSTAYCCIPHTSQPKAVQWDVFTQVSLHCLLLYPSHITAQGSPVRCFHSSLTPLLTAVSLTHHSPRQSSEMFSLKSHSTAYCCIPHTSQPKAVQWDVFTQVSLHCLLLYPSHITAQGSPVRCFHSSLTPLLTAVSLTHHSPRQSSEMFSLKSHSTAYCCIPHTSQPKAVQWDVFTQSHSTAYCCIPHTSQPKAVQWDVFTQVSLHCLLLYPSHITAQGSPVRCFHSVSLHCLLLYPSHITAQGSQWDVFTQSHSTVYCCIPHTSQPKAVQWDVFTQSHSTAYCCIPHTSQPKAVQWDVFTSLTPLLTAVSLTHHSPRQSSEMFSLSLTPLLTAVSLTHHSPKQSSEMFSLSLTPLLTAVSLTHHSPRQSSEMFSLSLTPLLTAVSLTHHSPRQSSEMFSLSLTPLLTAVSLTHHSPRQSSEMFSLSITPLLTAVSLTHHSPRQSSEMFSLKSHSTAYCCIPHTSQPKAVQWDVFTQVSLHCLLLYPSHITAQGSPVRCFHSSLTPLLTAVSLTHHSPRQSSEMFSLKSHSTVYCCIPHTSQPKAVQWDVFTQVSLHCLLLYPSHITAQGSPVRCFHSVSLHCLLLYPSHITAQGSPVRCFHSVSLHCLLLYPSHITAQGSPVRCFHSVSLHCLLLYPSHITAQGSPVRCFHSVSLHCLLLYPSHITAQGSPVRCFHSVSLHCLLLYPSHITAQGSPVRCFHSVSLHCLLLYPSHITAQGSPVRCFHSVSLHCLLLYPSHITAQGSPVRCFHSVSLHCLLLYPSHITAQGSPVRCFHSVSLHCLLLYPSHITAQGSPVRCFHSVSLHCLLLYPSHLTPQSSPVRCFPSVSLHCLLLYPSQRKAVQWDVFPQSHSTVYCCIPHSAKQSSEMFSLSLTPLFTAISLTVQRD